MHVIVRLFSLTRLQRAVQYLLIFFVGIAAPEIYATVTTTQETSAPLPEWSLTQLEERLAEIDARLNELAHTTLRSDLGAIGYRSYNPNRPDATDWVKVDLGELQLVDEMILVPTIWRNSIDGFQADAFPRKFNIVGGSQEDTEGQVLASYDADIDLEPGISPLVFQIPQTRVSWIRIDAIELTQRSIDSVYCLQLAELMVFSGMKNVAFNRPVHSATRHKSIQETNKYRLSWLNDHLVDGATPYIMYSSQGEGSIAYLGRVLKPTKLPAPPMLTIDLGESKSISEFRLHTADLSNTVPQHSLSDRGVPADFRIEAANLKDFSDATTLVQYSRKSFNQLKPILSWHLSEDSYQYVRIVAENVISPFHTTINSYLFGFAEIEILANNQNVALGKRFEYSVGNERNIQTSASGSIIALTDGQNAYGKILSTKDWMRQLAERHLLESERPLILGELDVRHDRQKKNIRLMTWLLVLATAVIGFIILLNRAAHIKQAAQLKERFAADLHDELGANLHTISLYNDLARDSVDSREELLELLERMREFTERSGKAARFCTNMLEAKGLCEDLVDEMQRTSSRILADIDYELSFDGEAELRILRPRRRIDLFLFFKEAITNIIRHSSATQVSIHIAADKRTVQINITDNGVGMLQGTPPSLQRRARLMGATVATENLSEYGTRITLQLNRKRFLFLR